MTWDLLDISTDVNAGSSVYRFNGTRVSDTNSIRITNTAFPQCNSRHQTIALAGFRHQPADTEQFELKVDLLVRSC